MNISGIMNDLNNTSEKLLDILSDVTNMVVVDGNSDATKNMKDKLEQIKNEILDIYDIIEDNKNVIQNCCDTLGLSVNFYS